MAGEIPQTAEELKAIADAGDSVSESLGKVNTVVDGARTVFSGLEKTIGSLTQSFSQTGKMTEGQTVAFGLLTTQIIGARKAFDSLDGISTKGLHTFRGQWNDLTTSLSNSPIGSQVDAMKDALGKLGVNTSSVTGNGEKAKTAIMSLADAFFESADNGVRLQNAMVQLASRTGNLGELTKAAGPNLENMNQLLETQQEAITAASQATKNSAQDTEQYYAQLGKIPGALKATVAGADEAHSSVSMLTATIQFAKGSGREYAAVVADMHDALKTYNLSTEDALKFTARMTEISSRFGVEFEDVQKSLKETSNLFKMFGNDTDGAARMMNNYLGALKGTGLSGKNALDVINGMTEGIKGMSLAQKSFLSAQTGGAGGLMGGFQIEKMLKDGKMDEVMEKVRQQMKKQFGTIATLDDAASSQQGAAQFNRQRMLLRQGPLGAFAKDDQSASKILEAFKAKDSGGSTEDLSKSIVQDTMKTGVDLQEKSVTILDRIRELMEAQQGTASVINYGTTQKMLTAGTGAASRMGEGPDPMGEMKDGLKQSSLRGAQRSAAVTTAYKDDLKSGIIQDKGGMFAVQVVQDYKQFFDDLAPALKAPIEKIRGLLKSGDKNNAQKEYDEVLNTIKNKEKEAQNLPEATKQARLRDLEIQKQMATSAYNTMQTTGGNVGYKKPGTPSEQSNSNTKPYEVVGRAATRAAQGGQKTADATPAGHTHQAGQHAGQDITVRVEGYCLDCGQKMNNTAQAKANTPAAHYGKGEK